MKRIIEKATNPQKTAIKMAVNQLGITDEDYRDILHSRFGVKSCTQLTKYQAKLFISDLKAKGFKLTPKTPQKRMTLKEAEAAGVKYMITPRQTDKINKLCGLIKWRVENGYQAWVKKFFKLDVVANDIDAQRVIEGLKKMFENQMKAEFGTGWHHLNHTNPDILWYIREHKK